MSRIVLGMSGGVDSSVAAELLLEQGHEVIGCHMVAFDTVSERQEAEDAARVADRLGIPLFTIDKREEFRREVIRYFVDEYISGRTPNPCLICNRKVKWQALMECMKEQGAELVATGHYARTFLSQETGRFSIQRSEKLRKDQSYVLFNLTQDEIAHTRFPLEALDKEDTRSIAREHGLFTSDKPDSQEICFIPDGSYGDFIREHLNLLDEDLRDRAEEVLHMGGGNYVDREGHVLGCHSGIINYTIGQRKGLGIAVGSRIFVSEIRPASNEVVLSANDDLFSTSLRFEKANFQSLNPDIWAEADYEPVIPALVKIRYADKGTAGVVRKAGHDLYEVELDSPVRAVTPGQAAVLYDDAGCIIGGGLIV